MIAAAALLVLAEATTTCATPARPRLSGGAMVVREDGVLVMAPFERLGPATSVVAKPESIQQTGAAPAADQPAEAPAKPCEAIVSIA